MNSFIITALLAYFGHFFGDYILQTDFLAKAKNRHSEINSVDRHGWIGYLIAHCYMWGVSVYAPMFWYEWEAVKSFMVALFLFVANTVIHFSVDWLKCEKKTTLLIDQLIHSVQIAVSLAILFLAYR